MPPVHPRGSMESEDCDDLAVFRVWTSGDNCWHLAGEADMSSQEELRAAMYTASARHTASASSSGLVLDCEQLSFIDVAGLRAIAQAANALDAPVVVNGANEMLRRAWSLLDLHVAAPNVEFST